MPPTNLFGLGYGVGPAGYGYPSVGRWSPLSLGSSLAAWYRADAGCFTDAACLFASASSQSASRASSAALQTGDVDFTICAWVKVTDILATYGVVSKGRPHLAGGEYEFFITTAGTVKLRVRKADDSGRTDCTSTDTVTAGTWAFIECYHDAAGDVIGVRVNNGTAVTGAHAGGAFVGTNAFAAGLLLDTGFMNGAIARVGFWKRLLTAGERTSLYNAGAGKFYADLTTAEKVSLVEYWNLCESSGDRVGSHAGLDLTPTNGPTVAAGPGEGACVDNSPCKRITDQSANGIDLTFPAMASQFLWKANQQNGRPMLIPDGVDDYASAVVGPALVRVWGGVWKFIDNVALQGLLCDGVDTYSIRRDTGLDYRGFATSNAGDFLNNGGTLRIDGVQTDSIASYDVANGYVAESVDNGDYATLGFRVGVCGGIGLGRLWKGGIGELYASSRAVTAGERSGMETYNRTRWGTA